MQPHQPRCPADPQGTLQHASPSPSGTPQVAAKAGNAPLQGGPAMHAALRWSVVTTSTLWIGTRRTTRPKHSDPFAHLSPAFQRQLARRQGIAIQVQVSSMSRRRPWRWSVQSCRTEHFEAEMGSHRLGHRSLLEVKTGLPLPPTVVWGPPTSPRQAQRVRLHLLSLQDQGQGQGQGPVSVGPRPRPRPRPGPCLGSSKVAKVCSCHCRKHSLRRRCRAQSGRSRRCLGVSRRHVGCRRRLYGPWQNRLRHPLSRHGQKNRTSRMSTWTLKRCSRRKAAHRELEEQA